jgi:hypothetical protein
VHEFVVRIAAATSELPRGKAEQITATALSTLARWFRKRRAT